MSEHQYRLNFMTEVELKSIKGIGPQVARAIVTLRRTHGNIDEQLLQCLCRSRLSEELLEQIDFTPDATLSPVDEDSASEEEDKLDIAMGGQQPETSYKGYQNVPVKTETGTESSLMGPDQQQGVGRDSAPIPESDPQQQMRQMCEMMRTARKMMETCMKQTAKSQPADMDSGSYSGIHCPDSPDGLRRRLFQSEDQSASSHGVHAHRDTTDNVDDSVETASQMARSTHRSRRRLPEIPTAGQPRPRTLDHGTKYRRPAIRDIPKSLTYDGKSMWQSFQIKFEQYAEASDWSASECKTCLLHCLTGKALDFGARLLAGDPDLPYRTLLRKMEGRFGAELPASAQAKFYSAMQKRGESVEDWADRVHQLATDAFRHISDTYCNQQAIDRFCQGLLDVEAGHSAFMQKWTTLEDAMNDVRLFLHSKKDMVSRRSTRSSAAAPVTAVDYDDSVAQVYAVQQPASESRSVTNLQKEVDELRQQLKSMMGRGKGQPYRGRGTRRSPRGRGCWTCGDLGHFQRNCPKSEKQGNLNDQGSG